MASGSERVRVENHTSTAPDNNELVVVDSFSLRQSLGNLPVAPRAKFARQVRSLRRRERQGRQREGEVGPPHPRVLAEKGHEDVTVWPEGRMFLVVSSEFATLLRNPTRHGLRRGSFHYRERTTPGERRSSSRSSEGRVEETRRRQDGARPRRCGNGCPLSLAPGGTVVRPRGQFAASHARNLALEQRVRARHGPCSLLE
jgi:hypothetical protein